MKVFDALLFLCKWPLYTIKMFASLPSTHAPHVRQLTIFQWLPIGSLLVSFERAITVKKEGLGITPRADCLQGLRVFACCSLVYQLNEFGRAVNNKQNTDVTVEVYRKHHVFLFGMLEEEYNIAVLWRRLWCYFLIIHWPFCICDSLYWLQSSSGFFIFKGVFCIINCVTVYIIK